MNNIDAILRTLAEQGYQGVELPFAMEVSPLLAKYGLHYAALHIAPEDLGKPDELIPHLHQQGCQEVCISGPLGWEDHSHDNFRRSCDFLNQHAAAFRQQGIRLHYHNHEFEFLADEQGQTPFAILSQHLDPQHFEFFVEVNPLL